MLRTLNLHNNNAEELLKNFQNFLTILKLIFFEAVSKLVVESPGKFLSIDSAKTPKNRKFWFK